MNEQLCFVETHSTQARKYFISYCLLPELSRHRQLLQTLVITSDENARWLIGLVKKVPMNGQQGSTLNATLGWGDSSHLWARDKHLVI